MQNQKHIENWQHIPLSELPEILGTDVSSGLTKREARARRSAIRNAAKHGDSVQAESAKALFITPRMPAWKCLLQVFRDPLLILLFSVSALTLFFGDNVGSNIAVFFVLFVNCFISGLSYLKAQRIRESTQLYSNPLCKVIREGMLLTTESRNIVPGDLLLLEDGDIVPCDARLLHSDRLRVVEFKKQQDGKMESHLSEKNASAVYSEEDAVHAPDFQNMVYGGSAVRAGKARALACAVGGSTYLGAMTGGIAPATGQNDPIGLRLLKQYCTRYGYITAFLIVPITLLGIFCLPQENISAVFLMALSLFAATMSENMLAAGRIIAAVGVAEISLGKRKETAVVKNTLIPDLMSTMTDLWLLGTCALNDGCYHVLRLYTAEKCILADNCSCPEIRALCEHIYLYSYGQHTALANGEECEYLHQYDPALRTLTDAVGTDKEELRVKTRHLRRIFYDRINANGVAVTTERKTLYTYMSTDIGLVGFCDTFRTAKGTAPMTDKERADLRIRYRNAISEGETVLIYASGDGTHVVFEGAVFMAKRTDTEVARYADEFSRLAIQTTVFADFSASPSPETQSQLLQSGICKSLDEMCVSDGIRPLSALYGQYRAYLGFSREEVANLASVLQQNGKVIGAVGVDNRNNSILAECRIEITLDSIRYHSERVSDAVWEKMPPDGREDSRRASQITRRSADLLINRFQGNSGGLRGIRVALYYARAFYRNLSDLLSFLVASQLLRLFMTLCPIPFGIGGLSAPSLLYSGLILDFLAVLVFAFSKPPIAVLEKQKGIPALLSRPLHYTKKHLICCLIASAGVMICTLIGKYRLHDATTGLCGFLFASLLLLQICILSKILLARKVNDRESKTRLGSVYRIFIVVAVLVIPAIFFIPTIGSAFGCALPHPILLALLPIGPVLYLLSCLVVEFATNKTA